jgi:hypothetical protein
MTPVSLRPFITVGNLGAWSGLEDCLGLDAFSAFKPCCQAFLVISLHVIVSYTCGVLYVLTLVIFPVCCCYALLLRR